MWQFTSFQVLLNVPFDLSCDSDKQWFYKGLIEYDKACVLWPVEYTKQHEMMMKQGNASPELDGKWVNFWVIYISFLFAYITVTVLFHDDFTHFPWTIRTSATSSVAFLLLKSYHRTLF